MDYKKLFKQSKTDIPKSLGDIFKGYQIVLELYDESIIEIIIEYDVDDLTWESFDSLKDYLDYNGFELDDLSNKLYEDQIRNIKKFIPNCRIIHGGYI